MNHKTTKSAIKNLEVQVGQLAKQLAEKSNGNFVANTEKNHKEKSKVVLTIRKRMDGLVSDNLVEGVVKDMGDARKV